MTVLLRFSPWYHTAAAGHCIWILFVASDRSSGRRGSCESKPKTKQMRHWEFMGHLTPCHDGQDPRHLSHHCMTEHFSHCPLTRRLSCWSASLHDHQSPPGWTGGRYVSTPAWTMIIRCRSPACTFLTRRWQLPFTSHGMWSRTPTGGCATIYTLIPNTRPLKLAAIWWPHLTACPVHACAAMHWSQGGMHHPWISLKQHVRTQPQASCTIVLVVC